MDENVIAHAFHHNAFLIVSNGDRARYGSITSAWEHFTEWKRLDEADKGSLDAEVMLNGMLAHDRLLDIVENFALFDESKPGATRKVIARNHQVLGVNRAVASVARQEELKREFPPERRQRHRIVELPLDSRARAPDLPTFPMAAEPPPPPYVARRPVDIVERAHPELGRLGVFWHTQGSGKSYSMAFFAEKVRRKLEGNFTFLLMTDRNDLDGQIYRTFVGCGIADDNTPRAESGDDQAEGLTVDLSRIDMEKLRDEFAKKVRHKATALRDIREIVEEKLAQMLARNPTRMDYQQKYEEIVADYNREKDRVTIEETFRRLTELIEELDAEQRRAVEEGLSEDELALFDLLKKEDLGRAARERVKQASRDLLASINARLKGLDRFWEKEQTKADVKVFILDKVYASLPTPPFSPEEKQAVAAEVYTHVWQQAVRDEFAMAA